MSGILHSRRFRAGFATLLAAVATLVTASQATGAPGPVISPVAVSSTSVSFSFLTASPTKAMLSISKDRSLALKLTDGLKKRHKFNVLGLKPDTAYNCVIRIFKPKGKAVSRPCVFRTKPRGTGTVSIRGNKLLLDGSPFFPVAAESMSCPNEEFARFTANLGVDILMDAIGCSGERSTWTPYLEALQAKAGTRLWIAQREPRYEQALAELPVLLRWPARTWFVSILIFGSCNTAEDDKLVMPSYLKFQAKASREPAIHMANISNPWAPDGEQNCYDVPSMETLIWLSVIGGAAGLDVKSILRWDSDAGARYKPELASAVGNMTSKLATIAPVLLGGQKLTAGSTNPAVLFRAVRYSGVTYVFAVNTDRRKAAKATFALPGTLGPRAQAVWTGRSVKVGGGKFTDTLPAGAWRLYTVAPKM